jgi:phenylacetate-CoA ligase
LANIQRRPLSRAVLSPGVFERTHSFGADDGLLVEKGTDYTCSAMTDAVFNQFLKALERTERMPLRDLAHYQEQLLVRLVRHASDNLPYYRRRLDPVFTADGDIDLSRWNDLPILTRDEAIARSAEMRVPGLSAEYGAVGEFSTSGSTGVALPVASNAFVGMASNALFTRMVRWFGLDTSRPLAVLRRFPDEPIPSDGEGKVETGWSFADPETLMYRLEILTPIERQLEWLTRHKAPYLLTFPSGALALAHAVTPEQGRSLGIEMVFLVGETVPEGAADLIAERLGARAAAVYACQEVGTIACTCNAEPHYHVTAENALVEIVDEHGNDVAPGGRGRVILTGLYNYAMPFIRYEIGDIAVAGAGPCSCGRTLPIITRIEGRRRNMFVFRDGTRFWPRYSTVRPTHAFVPFRRYQWVQLDQENIEFRYTPDGSGRTPDVAALNAYARQAIHPSLNFTIKEVETLVSGPSGKFEEFISNVRGANAAPVPDRLGAA